MLRKGFAATVVLLAALVTSAAADPAADPFVSYAGLPGKKALAVAREGDATVSGVAESEPSESAAAFTALQRCEEARFAAALDAACEIVRAGAVEVTSGATIRAGIPADAHPLFLWEFRSPTAKVYLAGSIHVMKPTLYPLPAQFDAAFAASDRIVVEVDTVNAKPEMLQQQMLQHATLPDGATIESVVSPETYSTLSTFLAAQEIPLARVARLRPAMLATQLAVARLVALGYMPNHGLEHHFLQRADDRPVLELESIADQLEVLTSPPPDVQEEMLIETLEQMNTIEPIVADMLTAWFSGDEADFMQLFELTSGSSDGYDAFMDRILDARNATMAERVSGYLATDGTYFVLVGSAHLAGPEGIPAILTARGYPGRRIYSTDVVATTR